MGLRPERIDDRKSIISYVSDFIMADVRIKKDLLYSSSKSSRD